MSEAIDRLRAAHPVLALHLAAAVCAPETCTDCPFGVDLERAPAGLSPDPEVNYHLCVLHAREEWAPEPTCTDAEWLEQTAAGIVEAAPFLSVDSRTTNE